MFVNHFPDVSLAKGFFVAQLIRLYFKLIQNNIILNQQLILFLQWLRTNIQFDATPPCRRVVDSGVRAWPAYIVYTCCRAHERGLWRGNPPASGPTPTPFLMKKIVMYKGLMKRKSIASGITICTTNNIKGTLLALMKASCSVFVNIQHRLFSFISYKSFMNV